MMGSLQSFLSFRGLPPHGYCLLWEPGLIWTHVAADAVIATSYFAIALVLGRLLAVRRDIRFGWMLGAFATFILACGLTHIMSIVTLWIPAYGLEALLKALTAAASLATAVLLLPLLPRLIAIPSPAALQRANDALRIEAEERARAEEKLRQSQKMEAVGQLAGGIAHDFNNLLGVIIASLDRAQRKGPATAEGEKALGNALRGAERAAKLTHQLLAFTRQQPLSPQRHDMNAIITGTAELLGTTLGGNIGIALDLASDLAPCRVDRPQLEIALVNLAINARDAMPAGGVITVATRRRDAAIEVSVADTGCGMDAPTLARAIDPFFTTKEPGKGTGLGLSQVVGSVEQMGGSVAIQSAPGTGTTVRLFVPAEEGANDSDDLPG